MQAHDNRPILLLDDDDDLRAMLAAAVAHYRIGIPVACASVREMIARADEVLPCTLALLDVNLGAGNPSGVDAYEWLIEHGFRGNIAFLTGHAAQHPLVQEARRRGSVQVLQKPIPLEIVCQLSSGVPA
jgi:FixJ family two-component response regulator